MGRGNISGYLLFFCLKGMMASHQPHISGKSNLLGFSHSRGKSGSVDSDLQFLGLSSPWQDKGIE